MISKVKSKMKDIIEDVIIERVEKTILDDFS